jgi:hypothetical protein
MYGSIAVEKLNESSVLMQDHSTILTKATNINNKSQRYNKSTYNPESSFNRPTASKIP